MFDKVHTALQHALDKAGIECPFPTQTLKRHGLPSEAVVVAVTGGRLDGSTELAEVFGTWERIF